MPPIHIARLGTVRIPVLRNGRGRFCVVWHPVVGGPRKRESFTKRSLAVARAEEIARAVAGGFTDVLTLTNADRDSYRQAMQRLAGSGIPLHAAIEEYMAARESLDAPHTSLVEIVTAHRAASARPVCPPAADILARLLDTLADDRRSEIYIRGIRRDLGHFVAAFPSLPAVTESAVREYLRGQQTRKKQPVSLRRRDNLRDAIVTLFRFAARHLLVPRDLSETIATLPRIARQGHVTTFSPAELRQILEYFAGSIDRAWLPWAALGAFAGLRTSEIYRLEWSAFKWQRGVIAISARVAEKVDTARHAPLLPCLAAWLADWQGASGRVLPMAGNLRALEHQQRRAIARCLAALHWPAWKHNALRHSFGSHRLAVLNDIARTALEMGNSPGQIRQHYNDSKDPVEAAEYFNLLPPPTSARKIIPMQQ